MPELIVCPRCGGSVPASAPAGLCPACLLGLGLHSTGRPADTPADDPDRTAARPATDPSLLTTNPDPAAAGPATTPRLVGPSARGDADNGEAFHVSRLPGPDDGRPGR